jgi:hypothetical protein
MPRKRVIYQSEALFVGPVGANFKYVTGTWDSGQYDVGAGQGQALASNRNNQSLITTGLNSLSTTGLNGGNITNGYYNTFFTGNLLSQAALNSGLLNNTLQLSRVQNANYGFDITRTDVNQYGQLAAIDRVIVEQPTVSLDFSYYASSGQNEQALGFVLNSSGVTPANQKGALADILSGGKDINNYYILVSPEGTDANIDTTTAIAQGKVIGIGNAGLTSYSIEAAVGGFPTVSVAAEGLNMKFYGVTTGYSPDVNPADGSANATGVFYIPTPNTGVGYTALRPGDILLSISGLGINASDLKIQNFSLSTDIGRDPIQKLGSKFAFSREITFPVTVSASVEAIIGDIAGTDNLGNALSDIVCNDGNSYNLTFNLGAPSNNCDTSYTPYALQYILKGAKLDSQSFSSAIGDNKSVTLGFSAQIGGPSDANKGLFINSNVQSV